MHHRLPVIVLSLAAAAIAAAGDNLLPNGSFDAGDDTALHWERANGLTTFFIHEKGRGRVLKMDTQVKKDEARKWAGIFAADPTRKAPKKTPVAQKSYATIGAADGVMLDSDFIAATPGQNYKLSVDIRGAGAPFVWIKGFMFHRRWRDAYQTRLVGEGAEPDRWRTYTIGFNPTARTPRVTRFNVRIYAYWPNGEYYFDNVRVEAITPAEMAALVKQREIPVEERR